MIRVRMFNQHLIIMKKQDVKKQFTQQSSITKLDYSLLSQLLSPIEILAVTKNYKPFNYRIGNKNYSITQDFCYYLKAITKAKSELFLKSKCKLIKHSHNSETKEFSEFIKSPLNEHRLPKRLINQLHEQHIYTISQVLFYGIHKISTFPYITKAELDSLIRLLSKNDCLNIFLRE